MKKVIPLDDLSVFEILQKLYPDKFPNDEDATWDSAMEFAAEIEINGETLDVFLGRLIVLTPTMQSGLTGKLWHAFGTQEKDHFVAVATREAVIES